MTYQFANSVQNKINELFANSVVTTGQCAPHLERRSMFSDRSILTYTIIIT